jgi:CheY-like chemotaxis protein
MSEKILLIEDDLEMSSLIADYLQNYDFDVQAFDKPKEALAYLKNHLGEYKIIVLDLMLPQMDGFDVCKEIRSMSDAHIIISSARNELSDKILGYGVGADDYLAKPYEPRELVLKINSYLRRNVPSKKKIGDFEIDEAKMEISLEGFYDGCRSVRRAVFYYQNMEYFGKAEYGTDDIFYVLPFIIGRDNYNAIRYLHINTINFRNKSSSFPLVTNGLRII